jgi:predicted ATPase
MGEDQNLLSDINSIKNNLSSLGMKVSLVYDALVGNEIAKDGGLVEEIKKMKEFEKSILARVTKVEEDQEKKQLYINIIWGAVGVTITILLTHFLNLIK